MKKQDLPRKKQGFARKISDLPGKHIDLPGKTCHETVFFKSKRQIDDMNLHKKRTEFRENSGVIIRPAIGSKNDL